MDDADRHAIERLITLEDEAWNAGDAEAYSRAVAEECIFTNIFGEQRVGREAFEAQHARIFAGIYRGTRLKQSIEHLRALAADVIAVDTAATVTSIQRLPANFKSTDGDLHTGLLQVFVRESTGWKIVAYHNVTVSPVASPGGTPT